MNAAQSQTGRVQSYRSTAIVKMRLALLLFFAAAAAATASVPISSILRIVMPNLPIGIAHTMWNQFDGEAGISRHENTLKNQICAVAQQIDDMHRQELNTMARTITILESALSDRLALELKLNDLQGYMNQIDVYYNRMKRYAEYRETHPVKTAEINVEEVTEVAEAQKNKKRVRRFERFTLENFASEVVAHHPDSVQSINDHIHEYFTSSRKGLMNSNVIKSLLSLQTGTDGGERCNLHESPHQVLIHLYSAAFATEVKSYAMMQFSYSLLRLYGKGNFTQELALMKENYLQRMRQKAKSMRVALENSSRHFWMCDPEKFVKGKNYLEITELLQGYIQNEVDLNPHGTCRENCAEYQNTKSYSCFKNLFCNQQRRCYGKVLKCKFVDSDSYVCPAATGSNRRYDYVEYEDGRVYGSKGNGCSRSRHQVDSWWRWLFWHCSYCLCLCDQQGSNSDRYINLRPVVSDIENNRIMTGMRFAKVGRIIHLQIQEGVLEKGGQVTNVTWVPIKGYNITDRGVIDGKDYHTLTFEKRGLDLDDLETEEKDQLLTGVRFQMLGSHLNFQIQLTSFDFVTGQLQPKKSYWKSNHNTDASQTNPRKLLKLDHPDVPTKAASKSQMDSKSDMYLEFTHSDFERDVGQTTVPFFDSQDVVSEIPVPLSGAGIYHKGFSRSGGFIAPKIITFNYHNLLEKAVDDLDPDEIVL